MSTAITLALALSPTTKLINGLFDDTFAGVHQLGWFDWAMLIPYFTILVILSVYGIHRYDVIRTYFKYRKNATCEPPRRFEQLPPVTIQLPIYNERYVVERLIDEVVKIEYPKGLLQIQVLDDSTDDTAPFAEALVERYHALGFPIEYHHRANREGYKAGALQEGLKTATGEFVAVFDADFCPPADFLERTIHHFADATIGAGGFLEVGDDFTDKRGWTGRREIQGQFVDQRAVERLDERLVEKGDRSHRRNGSQIASTM